MYLLPSRSTSVAPEARAMNRGEPPTDLNARTGLSTPPGNSCCVREKTFCDRVVFMERTFYSSDSQSTRADPCQRVSISRWTFDVVDHEHGYRHVLGLHRQAQLLGQRREQPGPGIGVGIRNR